VVGFGGQRASKPSAEAKAIRRVVESPVRSDRHPFLKWGDRVRVMIGPLCLLRGLEGILLREKNWCILALSVEVLQRSVAVEIDVAMAQRVGGRSEVASSVRAGRMSLGGLHIPAESLWAEPQAGPQLRHRR
jgi:hypothetical protein